MTERTFTLDEVKRIYRAGIRRGQEEATAYDWGCSPTSGEFDECIDEVHGITNGDRRWGDEGYVDWSTVAAWFKETV